MTTSRIAKLIQIYVFFFSRCEGQLLWIHMYFRLSWLAFYLLTWNFYSAFRIVLLFLFKCQCLTECNTRQVEHKDNGPDFDKDDQILSNQCSYQSSHIQNIKCTINHRIHPFLIFGICQFLSCHSEFTYTSPDICLPIHVSQPETSRITETNSKWYFLLGGLQMAWLPIQLKKVTSTNTLCSTIIN